MDAQTAQQAAEQAAALAEARVYLEQAKRALVEAQVAMGAAMSYGADLPELAAAYDASHLVDEVRLAVRDAASLNMRSFQ